MRMVEAERRECNDFPSDVKNLAGLPQYWPHMKQYNFIAYIQTHMRQGTTDHETDKKDNLLVPPRSMSLRAFVPSRQLFQD